MIPPGRLGLGSLGQELLIKYEVLPTWGNEQVVYGFDPAVFVKDWEWHDKEDREAERSMPKAELQTEWSYSPKLLNMQQHQNTPERPGRTKCLQFLLLCSVWQKDCKFRTILGNVMSCSLKMKRGHGCSSVVGYLCNMCKMVESISITAKEKKKERF